MSVSTIEIPRTLQDVTPEWMTYALSARFPGVAVSSVETPGFMGYKPNKARLSLTYSDTGGYRLPATMIVKGGFRRTDGDADNGLDIGVELELLSYAELVGTLDVVTPDCYFVTFDAKAYAGIMLIEDLAPSGAIFLNRATRLDYAQASAFVRAHARVHARWLGSAAFGPGTALDERTRRLHERYLDQLVRPAYWDSFITQPRGAALPAMLQDADRIGSAYAKLIAMHRTAAQTIVHGDEHLGNLYMTADGRAGMLDWCARREPWVLGFTYFLLSTVDALDRRAWERSLLELYLSTLTRCGAEAPGFEEAWFLYRCTTVFPMLTWLNNSSEWQPEAVNTRNTVRAAQAVIDHDALRLIGA